MEELNKNQHKILAHIKQCYPRSPSIREICTATGISSTSCVHRHIQTLKEHGYISTTEGLNRSIVLNKEQNLVPIIGSVTAGNPVLAFEEVSGYLPYMNKEKSYEELFALKVKGESMINAGIFDGDFVVAKRTLCANNGDIVVALIGDEATVKTFYKENGAFRLQPENDDYEPIITKELLILGKVIAQIRYY